MVWCVQAGVAGGDQRPGQHRGQHQRGGGAAGPPLSSPGAVRADGPGGQEGQ